MGTPFNDSKLSEEMVNRLKRRVDLKALYDIVGHRYTVAGGAILAQEPHDYDIYATNQNEPLDLDSIQDKAEACGWKKVCMTRNAMTLRDPKGRIFQFCTYAKCDTSELIRAFDFAHCQAGIDVQYTFGDDPFCIFHCTSEFMQAMVLQKTFFVGSEYPTSSLIRLVKYVKRGLYSARHDYLADILRILTAVINRGFADYEDFKDQMCAIDLNYESEEMYALWRSVRDHLLHPQEKNTGERPASDEEDDFPF